jgi:hypothetical protein
MPHPFHPSVVRRTGARISAQVRQVYLTFSFSSENCFVFVLPDIFARKNETPHLSSLAHINSPIQIFSTLSLSLSCLPISPRRRRRRSRSRHSSLSLRSPSRPAVAADAGKSSSLSRRPLDRGAPRPPVANAPLRCLRRVPMRTAGLGFQG